MSSFQLTSALVVAAAGEIRSRGLVTPMMKELYGPALARLKEEGLHFMSSSTLQE